MHMRHAILFAALVAEAAFAEAIPGRMQAGAMPQTQVAVAQSPKAVAKLRVCADPDNMPFSNRKEEGLENAIAKVLAREMKAELEYFWWPHQRGLFKRTLKAGNCDVLLGVPTGLEEALLTKPYYRTSYVMAYRADKGLKVASLDDPQLKTLKVGVQNNTPPWAAMGRREILDNVVEYTLFHDPGNPDRSGMPEGMFQDMVNGKLDVAMMWGPMAGYFAQQNPKLKFERVALKDETRLPMAFDMAMGVPRGQAELKAKLEAAMEKAQPEIEGILKKFGVPMLPMAHGGSGKLEAHADGEACEHHD
jgi:mxaJ protein